MNDFYEKLKKDHQDLNNMHKKQMNYAGLLLKAVKENVDGNTFSKILDKHFDLMKEYDSANP